MSLTAKQVELVRASWGKVLPISEAAAGIFYGKLFELDPALKPLFKGDITEQGRKLMVMLGTVVSSLDNLEAIVPAAQASGKRHVGYGVTEEMYDTVAEALIWTLGQGLGDDFTDDVKEAWVAAYVILSTVMKDAAKEVA